jgi:hypothetical protein
MGRTIQDIKLLGDKPTKIMREMPVPDGATTENLVHERMADLYANRKNEECPDAIRMIDEDTGDELYRWTMSEEINRQSQAAAERVRRLAQAELDRRGKGKDA